MTDASIGRAHPERGRRPPAGDAQHKGLTLSIDVTAMDTGMYRVYNVPMAEHGPDFDPDAGVEQAIEHTGNLIRELYRRSAERRDRQ